MLLDLESPVTTAHRAKLAYIYVRQSTRRAVFLAEMERVVPWSALCKLIEPFYPKPGNGRPPVGVERMPALQ